MRTIAFCVFAFCLFANFTNAQTYFEKHFGDTLIPETGIAAIQTKKGFIYYAGTITDTALGRTDIAFIKMDKKGNVIWKKIFGTSNGEYCNDMVMAKDSSFILSGYSFNYSNTTADWLMIKADTAGNLIWMKIQGKANLGESFNDVEITSDKGFIASGAINDTTGGTGNNLYVVKFDSLCNKQWEKQYGTALNDYAMTAKEESNGDFVLSGDRLLSSGIYNTFLMKINSTGSLLWNTDVVNVYNSGCKTFMITSSGDYLIVGEAASASSSKFDSYFVKLTPSGTIIWKRQILNPPEAEAAFQLYECAPNKFAVSGYGQKNSEGKTKVLFLVVDSAANELYRKYYGNYLVNMGYNISPSVYGGFLIAGFSTGLEDHYLLIADSIPLNVGMKELQAAKELFIYPNPAGDRVSLSVKGKLYFYNVIGEEVLMSEEKETDISFLKSGVYLLRFDSGEETRFAKLVKE